MNKLNLDDLDIKGTYIKEYVLLNKPISTDVKVIASYTYTYTYDQAYTYITYSYSYNLTTNINYGDDSQFSYVGIVDDNNINDYVTPYLDNKSKLNMDIYVHSNINDINKQISIIEDNIRNGIDVNDNNIKNVFNEHIDNDKKGVALNYSKDYGYYTEDLLNNIRNQLLDEYSYRYVTERTSELYDKL